MTTLVLADFDEKGLKKATLHTIAAARELAEPIHLLVVGSQGKTVASTLAQIEGVSHVWLNTASCYDHGFAENIAPLMASLAGDYSHLMAAATSFGKNIMPRVAALLDVAPITDITKILAKDTFIRPIYAGNAFATVQSLDPIKIMTIRTTAFTAAHDGSNSTASITELTSTFADPRVKHVSDIFSHSHRPELTSARIIISGGRALQNAENFEKLLVPLADLLQAAIGASRAAVDAGYVGNDYQVGQTGKIVAPELYMAIGISGAIQHLAGMKDSKVIIAINKDPEAPIMQIADFALQGDLFKIVPELIQLLQT